MLLLSKKHITIIALLLTSTALFGQPMEEEFGYFIFPIKPGVRNTLSGTMGELRSTHFHTGIDIRTGGQEGLAVVAAADGYISRIKVSPSGYGNTIYMMHTNGKTTVYAHLKSFDPIIEKYVKEAQYKKESFEVNLFPRSTQFIVNQGDTLALSGNSGSSGGPHLHFDIRDENQNLLNPLSYGFEEVIDTRSPIANTLAIVPFTSSTRVDGQFARIEYKLSSSKTNYYLSDTINAIGKLGMELYAWDRMNGTRFKTGINKIKVEINQEETFGQNIDTWSFSRARSFYQHVNYKSLVTKGKRYHKLYVDNGNNLRFYDTMPNNGQLNIEKGKYYPVNISLQDSYGNISTVKFVIYGSDSALIENTKRDTKITQNIIRHTLKIIGDSTTGDIAQIKTKDNTTSLKSSYLDKSGKPVFLWNLDESIPESINIGDTILYPKILSFVPPRQEYKVFNSHADVLFSKNSLFDSLYFSFDYQIDTALNIEKIFLGNPDIPVKGTITATFKPSIELKNKEQAAVYSVYGRDRYGYVGGNWKDSQIEFKTRNFGVYTILEDTIAPTIKPLIINKDRIVFKFEDERSGLKDINASLNGEWLLIAKDPKKKLYWAEKQFKGDIFTGELVLEVTDNANNKNIYSTKIY
jgi:hypothetical protein